MACVSVIVPVYNAAQTLERCVASVKGQTFADWELLLIDDGSRDDSLALARRCAEADGRIRCLHKENGGVSSARNAGLEAASGRYVAFLDADDAYDPPMLETLVTALEKHGAELALCGYYMQQTDLSWRAIPLADELCPDRAAVARYAVERNDEGVNMLWNKLFVRSKIKAAFDEGLAFGEDAQFVLRYLTDCARMISVAAPLYRYAFSGMGSLGYRFSPDRFEVAKRQYQAVRRYAAKYAPSADPFKLNRELCLNAMQFMFKYVKYEKASLRAQWRLISQTLGDPVWRQVFAPHAKCTRVMALLKLCTRLRATAVLLPVLKVRKLMQGRRAGDE